MTKLAKMLLICLKFLLLEITSFIISTVQSANLCVTILYAQRNIILVSDRQCTNLESNLSYWNSVSFHANETSSSGFSARFYATKPWLTLEWWNEKSWARSWRKLVAISSEISRTTCRWKQLGESAYLPWLRATGLRERLVQSAFQLIADNDKPPNKESVASETICFTLRNANCFRDFPSASWSL